MTRENSIKPRIIAVKKKKRKPKSKNKFLFIFKSGSDAYVSFTDVSRGFTIYLCAVSPTHVIAMIMVQVVKQR